ncbi:hypothetical protein [Flavobacterium sp. GCM10023249]|uniref:hypothetical protein n=1 Tax=unclassified Flavobacterium TaxID=196869 RepID=UPI003620E7AD
MSRLLSSILIIAAGAILLLDKISVYFNIKLNNNYGFADTEQLAWACSQTIALLIVIFANQFKPYKISYYIPIYISFLQLHWIFFSTTYSDTSIFNWFVFGASLLFALSIFFISSFFNKDKEQKERLSLLESVLDLTYLQIQRSKKTNEA